MPLYLNGARMSYFSAIMPIYDGMGLVFAVTSYDGRVVISPTSCREQMPDPEFFAQCLRESFQEYLGQMTANAGSRVQELQSTSDHVGQIQTDLTAQRQAISGVDPNEELVRLLEFQRLFQSAARFISTVNQAYDDLMNVVR